MKYGRVIQGTFIDRPNRFIASVEITDPDTGQRVVSRCHVKNTGGPYDILMTDSAI